MCFNLNLLNICLAKSSNNNNNNNNSNNKNKNKKNSNQTPNENDSLSLAKTQPPPSFAIESSNKSNNNSSTILVIDHSSLPAAVSAFSPNSLAPITTTTTNTTPTSATTQSFALRHPRTLALKHSNNFDQTVNELECENEETLNSLYLANNISYLVDQDRIVDTPCNHVAALDDSIELDYFGASRESSPSDDDDDDYFSDFDQQGRYPKSSQPLLKFLSKPARSETAYKSISLLNNQSQLPGPQPPPTPPPPPPNYYSSVYSNPKSNVVSSIHPPPRPSQNPLLNNNNNNNLFKASTSVSTVVVASQATSNKINNQNDENNNDFSSSTTSSSKSSSLSSLINTSSNQSPYSSLSTLTQQQQQQQQQNYQTSTQANPIKFKPVRMFSPMSPTGGAASNNNNDGSGEVATPNRPSLVIRPTVTPPSTNISVINLRPKQNVYDFKFDSQNLIARPNELSRDDQELSSRLDELNSNSDESLNPSARAAAQGSHHHHHQHHQHQGGTTGHHHHHHHHHQHHQNRGRYSLDNIKSRGGKITISSSQVYEFKETDFEDLGQIGNGEFGSVHMVRHTPSQTLMAMKRVGPTVGNQGERKKVLKELDFVLECNDYRYVVRFYGVKFNNEPADCLICMELMDTSLEKFYKFVYDVRHEEIPEEILGKVVVAAVNALNYLKEEYQIIHRDVKPSNMLINRRGEIKMCDFGISGKLVDSIAASRDAGCQLYMAPERIDPTKACANGYDVRSDVWSLGLTLYELATGKFPYPQWKTIFHQLKLVVDNAAPQLESERLTPEFKDFVNTCLTKDETKRPKYKVLLQHPLIQRHSASTVNVAAYVEPYINEMKATGFVK